MALALILAAGSGERLGARRPKAFVELAGRSMLAWSVRALAQAPEVRQIVLVVPAGGAGGVGDAGGVQEAEAGPVQDVMAALGEEEARALAARSVMIVGGGATRSESVRAGLVCGASGDPVLVHDAARPLVTPALVSRAIAALRADPEAQAAIAAVPVTDTIKRVGADGAVLETLAREQLWAVQTPQVFRHAALERALDVPAAELARATDDAWLVERAGGRVIVVPSEPENIKVTSSLDLDVAAELLSRRDPA